MNSDSKYISDFIENLIYKFGVEDELPTEIITYLNYTAKHNGVSLNDIYTRLSKKLVLTAVHEVGHLITGLYFNRTSRVTFVSSLGTLAVTEFFPPDIRKEFDRVRKDINIGLNQPSILNKLNSLQDYLEKITALYGGFCAEDIVFGTHDTGCKSDLDKASNMLFRALTIYGYGPYLLSKDNLPQKQLEEVKELALTYTQKSQERAYNILDNNIDLLLRTVEYLVNVPEHSISVPLHHLDELDRFLDNPDSFTTLSASLDDDIKEFNSVLDINTLVKLCKSNNTIIRLHKREMHASINKPNDDIRNFNE